MRAEEHKLLVALGVSAALHAFVLAWRFAPATNPALPPPGGEPLSARLVEPRAELPPSPAPAPAPGRKRERPAATALTGVAAVEEPAEQELTLGQYRYRVIAAALSHRHYPVEARRSGWEGEVIVSIAAPAGGAPMVELKSGSGNAALDEQALAALRAALPRVPVPLALRASGYSFEVKTAYRLGE